MVCYNSMTPLPLPTSILCSASILCSFSYCAHRFCSTSLSWFYTLCCLCMLYTASLISTSGTALRLCLLTDITLESLQLFSVLHIIHTLSHLPDHHTNSSSSLVVIQGSLASLAVILRIFCFSVSRNS
jgi:hypothetical protein